MTGGEDETAVGLRLGGRDALRMIVAATISDLDVPRHASSKDEVYDFAAAAVGTPVRDGTSAEALAIMKLVYAIYADEWRRRYDIDPVELA